ncbi:MAG: MFS transporter [Deltaproteobacteria bacterium]|nr:MFS transporter [Deltaproteobacteria bacterium]
MQTPPPTPAPAGFQSTFFYGWIILLGGFLILVVDGGVRFSFGVLVKPLAAEFGWDRGAITFAYTLNMFVFGFGQMMAGRMLDRYGPRLLFSVSALLASAGIFLTSRTNSIPELYFYYGVVTAVGVSGITIGVVSSTVSRWFLSLRGVIGGIAVTGTSFGHFAVIPALAYSQARFGWRGSWVGLGVLVSAVVVPVALTLMKKEPADMGLAPYKRGGAVAGERHTLAPDLPPREAFLSRTFFFIVLAYGLCGFQDFFFVTQFIPFATDAGLTSQHASNIQGLAGLFSMAGVLAFPALTVKLGHGPPLSFMFLLRIVCFGLLAFSSAEPAIFTAALLMGFTLMATAPLAAAMTGDYFGVRHIGLITGAILWMHHTGGALGALSGGLVHDATGSYGGMFLACLVMAFAGAAVCLGIRPPSQSSSAANSSRYFRHRPRN